MDPEKRALHIFAVSVIADAGNSMLLNDDLSPLLFNLFNVCRRLYPSHRPN